ncbi:uncharacterized protein PRCAT00002914001 [Priceomyces carsonii]|uniref:uncharacterized protein n=1 Tax=Priceomyces carsonii TaxID=28549 RepID=UPI002EDB5FC3|nr:unnamed protein product [Priceomyces carsonii]
MSLEAKIRKFLKGPKKGETFELRNGLVSQYKHERKDAIQRVIQAMTVGKDVSSLFPDVLKNIATYDIEQKKLVYLYLMNYAKTHPELCILAVNTFVQDTEDPNPLIRALAIRTMGCIRVSKMIDYMEIPLLRTLKDDNPYVRKTAAICVAKLFDLDPEMCIEFGFLDELKKLIHDSNPMVVANSLSALFEIKEMNDDPNLQVFTMTADIVKSLLTCLNECTEWGRITILSELAEYNSASHEEANHIVERVIPQLQHVNPSVVLSSIKVIIHHISSISPTAQRTAILKKLSAPLVSLVSTSIPEAQYVGLKNIRIILEKYPQILSKELRVFFIKYSDPLYLKLEKLEIMVRLATDNNSALLLGELKEYALEFEPALVSKAIKSIGSVAIKLAGSVIKAVNLLNSLIDQRGGELTINESIIVLINILRRYPGKNDLLTLIIPVISEHAKELDNSDALSGYIWLLGEYPKYFSGLHDKLNVLVDKFLESESILQLNILTTIVKINLSQGESNYSSLLQQVLEMINKDCENADVRDQAFIYWRLLSTSSKEAQKKVILAKLPPIKTTISSFNPTVLNALIEELSTLSSVYHKPASTFINLDVHQGISTGKETTHNHKNENIDDLTKLAKQEIINNAKNENLLDFDDEDEDNAANNKAGEPSLLDELDDIFSAPAPPIKNNDTVPSHASNNDILSLFDSPKKQESRNSISSGLSNLNFNDNSVSDKKNASANNKVNNDLLDLF